MSDDYVLGTADEELSRLGFQAHVWRNVAHELWERAGFRWGQDFLDVGCGPGFATVDLARIAGPEGSVLGVDLSSKYLSFVEKHQTVPLAAPVTTRQADVQTMELAPNSVDGAFERWCLCFVPDPAAAIRRVAQALRPGGAFAIFEYADYESMGLAPEGPALKRLIGRVADTFREGGGDPNLARRLPQMLADAGLILESMQPRVRVAEPGSELWQWPDGFFHLYGRSLVQQGKFEAADQEAFEREWAAASANPHARFYTPLLLEIVARKPR
jgi:ubiquinone/menaquinone biosynthesis C-methylase UbiE